MFKHKPNKFIMKVFYFQIKETNWRQKTLAIGIGRWMIEKDYKCTPYLCIGLNLIFWYLTFGVRIGSATEDY